MADTPRDGSTVTDELNRLANDGTYPIYRDYLAVAGAANKWAGTAGLAVVGALNVKAGNALPNYLDLQGVCNQLAGTDGLAPPAALRHITGAGTSSVYTLDYGDTYE